MIDFSHCILLFMLILFERNHYFFAIRYWLSSDCIPLLCPPYWERHIVFVTKVCTCNLSYILNQNISIPLHAYLLPYPDSHIIMTEVIRPFLYHYNRGDQTVFISLWQRWSDRFYIIMTEVIRPFLYHYGRDDQTVFISLWQRWSDRFYIIMTDDQTVFISL